MRRGFGSGNDAVSDVIGTVLLLGITVAAFSVLSIAVLDQFDRNPPPARIEFRVDTVGERTSITAVWGESVDIADTKLIYKLDDARTIRELTVAPLAANLIHRIPDSATTWDVGETIRLACPIAETCAHPGKAVTDVSVLQVTSNTVLFSSEVGVSRGSTLNPVADLVLTFQSVTDPLRSPTDPLYNGGTIEAVVKIKNDGVLAIPTDRQLNIRFYMDGSTTPFHSASQTGGLAPGASFTITTPTFSALTGTHALRAAVEATPAVLEAAYGNNQVIRSVPVIAGLFDPGQPYEDGNADILYNPYVASDTLLAASVILDGTHTAAAGKGLVIPPSIGSVVAANSISFSAPSGGLVVRVGLQATNPVTGVTLHGATSVNMTGTFDIKGRDDVLVTSSGQIDLSGIRLDSNSDAIRIRSTGGRVLAVNTAFGIAGISTPPALVDIDAVGGAFLADTRYESTGAVTISSGGPLYVNRATFAVASDIILDLGGGPERAYVAQARFDDANDQAEIQPGNYPGSGRCAVGTPIFGTVDDAC